MAEDEVPVVKRFADALNDVLLSASRETRPSSFEKIPPPLSIPELDRKFGKTKDEMLELLGSQESTVIELAFKKVFLQILVWILPTSCGDRSEAELDIDEHDRAIVQHVVELIRRHQYT